MLNEAELLGRIRRFVLEGKAKKPCTAILLYHVAENGAPDPLDEWNPQDEDKTPEVIAAEISGLAHDDAKEGKGGEQSYLVGFFFGEGASNVRRDGRGYGARYRFSITSPGSFESEGEGPEMSPDIMGTDRGTGKLAHAFSRDLAKLTIPWANSLLQSQQNTIMRLEAQVNELMAERRRNIVLQEKLASQAHKRQLQMRKVVFWEKQKEEVASIIFPMIAPLLAAVAGRPMLPSAPTDETKAFEEFAQSLSDEQIAQLQMQLKPHQLPAVFQIVQAVKAKQPVSNVTLREFAKSVDEGQMEGFKEILTGEQFEKFLMIVVGYMQKHKAMGEEAKKAYEQEAEPVAEEEEPLGENDVFDP